MKIANKISFSFFVVALILASIAASIFYLIAEGGFQKAIDNTLAMACCFRSDHIKTYLNMLKVSVDQLSKSVILENLLKINDKGDPQQTDAFAQAMKRLKLTKEVNPAIAEFLLLDKIGKVAASSNESSVGVDKSTDALFLGGQKETYIKDVYYSKEYKEFLMAVSAPVLDSQTGQFLGVLASRVRLADLNNITASGFGMGKTGEIYIVNKYGYMITPSRFKEDTILKQRVNTENVRGAWLHREIEHLLSQDKLADVFSSYRGIQVLGAHKYIPQVQWTILAEMDTREAFEPLHRLRLIFFLILLITPIAAWLVGVFIAGLITGPLHRLQKGTEIIGTGDLDYRVGTDAEDEVGELSRAFDKMTESLRKIMTSINTLNKEIIEREKAEEMLRSSEEKFRAIFNNANDGILLADEETKKFYTGNNTICQMLGYGLEEIKKLGVADIHPKEDLPYVIKQFERQVKKEIAVAKDLPVKRKDGTIFYADVNTSSVALAGRTYLLGLFRDVTERRKAEEELSETLKEEVKSREIMTSMLDDNNQIREELERKLEELKQSQGMLVQSEKLASLGTLVSDMAHEVNNPLMIISGNAQLSLMEDLDGHPAVKESLAVIKEQCMRAKDIIQRLLMFSRPSKDEVKEVDINESINFIIKLLEHQYSLADIKIVKNYTPSLPKVKIDEKQMHEVFINLIKNAAEAMCKGGTITVSTKKEADNIRVDFKDTGEGIAEENIKKIFDPFFTTKEQGTGLGLSVCYGIVQAHGGELKYESRLGEGTTATILLPVGGKA